MPQLFGPQAQTILLEIFRLSLRLAVVAAIFVPLDACSPPTRRRSCARGSSSISAIMSSIAW